MTRLFLANAPVWYKWLIIGFLVLNLAVYGFLGPWGTGWLMLAEFLIVLSLALYCYPLFSGGLIALEALALKMTSSQAVLKEITANIDVIMLLMFLVPSVYFMKPLMTWLFMRLVTAIKSKVILSLFFLTAGAFLSAWLDALTVIAVMMSVCWAIKDIEEKLGRSHPEEREQNHGFLRNLLMHGAIGTALGGVSTMIGEPQNLLLAHYSGWGFKEFYLNMAGFSIPLQVGGLIVCWALEHGKVRVFGFGYQLPRHVAEQMALAVKEQEAKKDPLFTGKLVLIGLMFLCLVLGLVLQIAPIGILGLGMLVGLPIVTGQIHEKDIGKAFEESMPFTALLVVFFIIVSMIDTQHLFSSITTQALHFSQRGQLYAFFFASGILSAVSDNVFVASVYLHEALNALRQGVITQPHFNQLLLMINLGTNIFSIVTPVGQAAFLFLLTSPLARQTGLSFLRMLLMSFPYAVVLITIATLRI